MTYDINTLYQDWLSDPKPFKYGYNRTYQDFLTYHSGNYNNAVDDGLDPDPVCAWVMLNAPDELPSD